ncbi:MAG: hypothetical protein QM346_07270 [Chloroflexota bacterium]|jgi:hypothetical protein|nr:hypothetical protein [Chloroflexota bacterium]
MSRRLSDTIPETEAILTDLLRQTPPWRKLQMVDEMNALVRRMALSGLHERHPQVSSEELQRRLGDVLLGLELAEEVYGSRTPDAALKLIPKGELMVMNANAAEITLLVCRAFEELGIPYVIVGSLASAVHGHSRSTYDCDIVAGIYPQHVPELIARLHEEFHISEAAIYEALERRSSFNLIHLGSLFKVDVFVPKERPFEQAQLARGRAHIVADDPERMAVVASPEDVILAKLEWYRLGGESSERQWEDVLGVLRVQGDRLDRRYLKEMAGELGVTDLLEQAEAEAL